jgi:teichuronic acid biosynthesis glycosyltransferase TuaG
MYQMPESQKGQNELVSIVIPVFNTDKYVGAAIQSVQNQSYANWELILVDDFSSDHSLEVCKNYQAKDNRIHVFQMDRNSGALAARNFGISQSKGRYLCFLDSDDTFESTKLEKQVEFMKKNEYAVSFTLFQRIKESGSYMGAGNVPFVSSVSYRQLLGNPAFSIITIMIDKQKVDVPLLDADIVKAEDYIFHLRLLKQGVKAYGIDEALSNYRYRPGSQSTSFLGNSKDLWKALYEIEKIGLPASCFYFSRYLFKGVQKRIILYRQLLK